MENNNSSNTQRIIQRLTVQAFAIKGFSFTFIGLIGNILKDESNIYMLIASYVAILVFWYLDAFYLKMEKIYRKLEKTPDLSKGLDYKAYGINICIGKTLFNKTVTPIYFVQAMIVTVIHLTVTGMI